MALIPAKWFQCGADLQIDNTRDFFFCNYCGAKMLVEKQYIEYSGKVSISGMASENSWLERESLFVNDGRIDDLETYTARVISIVYSEKDKNGEKYYIFKGDNNDEQDPKPIHRKKDQV